MPDLEELVTIKLDKERHLRLTLKGMLEFEKLTGKNLMRGFSLKNFAIAFSAKLQFSYDYISPYYINH